MAYTLIATRDDGTSFNAAASTEIDEEGGTGGQPLTVIFSGVGWCMAKGVGPAVRTGKSKLVAGSSSLFAQHLGSAIPSRTRYVMLESTSGGYVAELDGSNQVQLNEGYYIDVTNSDPPVIGQARPYSATALPDTQAAIVNAEQAMAEMEQSQDPDA